MTTRHITKDTFVEILRDVGLTDSQMEKLHRELETRFPEDHARLLAWLGEPDAEVAAIRDRSR